MVENGWDPLDHANPAEALTLRIRGLAVGQAVGLSNGRVVKSVTVRHGGTHIRRFAVGEGGGVGRSAPTYRTAAEAAQAALRKGGKKK